MTLLVRDGADVLGDWFDHHRKQGVGRFIVTDNGSTDGSVEIARSVGCDLLQEPSHDYRQSEWVDRMAAMVPEADWIVPSDVDEFWEGLGTLCRVPSGVTVAISHPWHNHLPRLDLVPPFRREDMPDYVTGTSSSFGPPTPSRDGVFSDCCKIAHRPSPTIRMRMGNHGADHFRGRAMRWDPLRIHHYPVRSYAQFEDKVVKGGTAYESSSHPPHVGRHWRRWYEEYKDGNLLNIYESLCKERSP